ncbi:hypothetical protein GGR56DRAFT_104936 [Xylariaceae sp. FL0804]|nr:hypothetical protein GGR56DRAFT_104936 [Xylariaceae sp. FL0804]
MALMQSIGGVALALLRLLAHVVYVLTWPLRYPLYGAYALVAFVLSPLRSMFGVAVGGCALVVNAVQRLKYLYVYIACAAIIGICAGFVLHGTSSYIFVLLGVDASSRRAAAAVVAAESEDEQRRQQQQRRALGATDDDEELAELEEEDEEEEKSGLSGLSSLATTTGGDNSSSSSRLSWSSAGPPGSRRFRPGGGKSNNSSGGGGQQPRASDMLDSQWKLLRSADKPRRRRRGLLSQTIHEESSESDFT